VSEVVWSVVLPLSHSLVLPWLRVFPEATFNVARFDSQDPHDLSVLDVPPSQ